MANSNKTLWGQQKRQEVKTTKTYLPSGMKEKINTELKMKEVKWGEMWRCRASRGISTLSHPTGTTVNHTHKHTYTTPWGIVQPHQNTRADTEMCLHTKMHLHISIHTQCIMIFLKKVKNITLIAFKVFHISLFNAHSEEWQNYVWKDIIISESK